MLAGIVSLIFGLIELLLATRFVLLLVGANPGSQFASWVYSWSDPFVAPFANIFGQHAAITTPGLAIQSVLDWTTLVALVVYAIIGGLLVRLLAQF